MVSDLIGLAALRASSIALISVKREHKYYFAAFEEGQLLMSPEPSNDGRIKANQRWMTNKR
jgi:hypothetical protein